MKRTAAAVILCLTALSANAGSPMGPLPNDAPRPMEVRSAELKPDQRLACEAIVCLSLISAPGPSCRRSLDKFDSLRTQQRLPFLAVCPQSKWFDLADVIKGWMEAPRASQALQDKP